jgi:hypothetical protein
MRIECRHIHVMGRRCGSPALKGQPYCYFHARSRTRHLAPDTLPTVIHPLNTEAHRQRDPILAEYFAGTSTGPLTLDFPPIEDRESIQVAASMIIAALGRNLLEPKRAASMLYALQVATAVTRPDDDGVSEYHVQIETVLAPDGTDLAPEPSTP